MGCVCAATRTSLLDLRRQGRHLQGGATLLHGLGCRCSLLHAVVHKVRQLGKQSGRVHLRGTLGHERRHLFAKPNPRHTPHTNKATVEGSAEAATSITEDEYGMQKDAPAQQTYSIGTIVTSSGGLRTLCSPCPLALCAVVTPLPQLHMLHKDTGCPKVQAGN
jgi:hypothetical protein